MSTIIATHAEVVIERGRRTVGIGLAERNLVTKKTILLAVKCVVITDYDPVVSLACHFRPQTSAVV